MRSRLISGGGSHAIKAANPTTPSSDSAAEMQRARGDEQRIHRFDPIPSDAISP
jgi:hypothetical protein